MTHHLPIIAASAWAILLAGGGGALTEIGPWYRGLRKPAWQPPDWAFGPIWTVILVLAAWAGVMGWGAASAGGEALTPLRPSGVALSPGGEGFSRAQIDVLIVYGVNFLAHAAWSPLFFKLKRPDWSLVESVFLWVSIAAMIAVLAPLAPVAAWMLAPYIVWVTIATVLNYTIVRLNGPFGARAGVGSG